MWYSAMIVEIVLAMHRARFNVWPCSCEFLISIVHDHHELTNPMLLMTFCKGPGISMAMGFNVSLSGDSCKYHVCVLLDRWHAQSSQLITVLYTSLAMLGQ